MAQPGSLNIWVGPMGQDNGTNPLGPPLSTINDSQDMDEDDFSMMDPSGDILDYFGQLELALKKKKEVLREKLGKMPPVISRADVFTIGIPHYVDTDMANRTPSNRIATNYSPTAAVFESMRPYIRRVHREQASIFADYLASPFYEGKPPWQYSDGTNPIHANEKLYLVALAREGERRRLKSLKRSLSPSSEQGKLAFLYPENERMYQGGSPKMIRVVPSSKVLEDLRATWKKPQFDDDAEPSTSHGSGRTTGRSGSQFAVEGELIPCPVHHVLMGDKQYNADRKVSAYEKTRSVSQRCFPAPPVVESPRSRTRARRIPHPGSPQDVFSAAENILKYEYYLENGIEERYITALNNKWLTNAAHRIGHRWQLKLPPEQYHYVMVHVALEVKYQYLYSMRKAILDYVLKVTTACFPAQGTTCLLNSEPLTSYTQISQ